MEWIYNGNPVSGIEIVDFKAFVYCITNNTNGKRYFGKKRLQFVSHKRKIGRKNRIKTVKESDWKDYWGSSEKLLLDIKELGEDAFQRHILRFCKSLSESSYYELKFQMENDVLLKPEEFYNEYVGGRISRRQMGIR